MLELAVDDRAGGIQQSDLYTVGLAGDHFFTIWCCVNRAIQRRREVIAGAFCQSKRNKIRYGRHNDAICNRLGAGDGISKYKLIRGSLLQTDLNTIDLGVLVIRFRDAEDSGNLLIGVSAGLVQHIRRCEKAGAGDTVSNRMEYVCAAKKWV